MEAEEPQHKASTPIPGLGFILIPEALMRSSQSPALGPKAQESQDSSYKWAEGCRLSEAQQRNSMDVSDYVTESKPSFPKEDPENVGTNQENPVAEVCDTPELREAMPQSLPDSHTRTLHPLELWACPDFGESLDMVPIFNELGSGVEADFRPELLSLTLGAGQAEKEETSSDSSTQIRFQPPCEEDFTETTQLQDSESGTVSHEEELKSKEMQESHGQEGLMCPQGAHGLEEQGQQEEEFQGEGTLGEGICFDGLLGELEQTPEQIHCKKGEQRQKQEQVQDYVIGEQGERERLNGELGHLNYSEWGQEDREWGTEGHGATGDLEQGEQKKRELRKQEESKADTQYDENQSLVQKSEKVTGKQEEDRGLKGTLIPAEEQEEEAGSSEEEPANQNGKGLGAVGEERSVEEKKEYDGPSTLAQIAPGISSPCNSFPETSCPISKIFGTQAKPRAGELLPITLTPRLETGWSHQPISPPSSFSAAELPVKETTQDSQQERPKLGRGTVSIQGAREVSANSSVTPPRTQDSAPSSPAHVSPSTTASTPASPPVVFHGKETFLAVCPPETFRASLSINNPSLSGASETSPALLHGFPSVEAAMDSCANPDWVSPQSPIASSTGAVQHLRSNSFPGSHRTEQTPDLAGTSLSFFHSELPERPPKPAIYGSVIPRRDRRSGRGCSSIPESNTVSSALRQDSQEFTSNLEIPGSPHSSQPWGSPHNSAFASASPTYDSSPSFVSVDMRTHEPPAPPPLERRHIHPSIVERDGHLLAVVPTLKRHSHPPPLSVGRRLYGPPKGPLPQVPDPLVARQHRPLPSTPDMPHHTQTSFSPRLRYNKPLPPTPDLPLPHQSPISSSSNPRIYKPLPPVPIMDPTTEPPPLPPKTRGRSKSTQRGLMNSGGHAKPTPICQEWTVSTPPSAGRTSWPPAIGRSTDTLASTSRSKSEVSPGMAFSNITNLLSPSSPTTPWTVELQGPTSKDESRPLEESEAPVRGTLRRTAPPEVASGPRRSDLGLAKQLESPSHPHLEKASSWPHRRDPGIVPEGSSGHDVVPGEGPSKNKGWNRQGLRRPSILPEGSSDMRSSTIVRSPGPSDTIVFREKKPKEVTGGFSRRCSKLINSSQLLYQEYSDVVLNKEIQSQQLLDSVAEAPGPISPWQPRKALVSSESYLQRLSMASSGSLWQEIPVVRNSTVLLSMTHEDQKLQEAKFELIVSEASYLRSLQIAVDHFQLSTQLRSTLSNQDHQWLFSRLQDVRNVSTTFLSDLEENFENNIFTFQVCDVVLNHAPNFRRVYLPYVTNQTYQERTFQSLLNSNSNFREVLEKLESDPICQRLSLKSFLILPFQRITRLKLLLQNILKRTQPGSSEEAEATKAHHALEELIRDCNNNVQRMRRTEELIYLSQKIEFECKIFPLISQSRWLVKSGELTALEFSASPGLRRKLSTRPVHLHLFNDCLLLSRPREGNRFLVFDHAPFSSVRGEKCEMKLHGPHKNLFRLFLRRNAQGTQAEFLFRTETQSEKLRWISALVLPREELDLLECYDSPQVQCLRAYKPRENDELALEKADVVMVTQQSSDGWLEGVRLSDGERGWFPLQQVEFISNQEVCARNLKEAQRVKTAKLQLVEQQT
ncbi:rho guanine nucleotide exchange factor 5 [Choloepus didactylus]|uniref:rho guanine nucleotide exchange factor 5 n=1 Tax=Choloepus didactylus TaxID=27675 RepID=UPI00189C90B1|nr:rho guanine nucleotide exchange factor 5 [Choloepus didactylus]